MKIYFFPNKRGPVYIASANHDRILMDTIIVDTEGLVSLLEERCGLFTKEESFNRRMCEWYAKMKPWLDSHPDNILFASYKLNPLAMAKEMLNWRDKLKMVDWNFEFENLKTRLGAVAAIEKSFNFPSLADRLIKIINEIKISPVPFKDVEIILPYNPDLLPSLLNRLMANLKEKGAKISVIQESSTDKKNLLKIREILSQEQKSDSIELDVNDTSFKILKFKTRKDEEEYFAYKPIEKESLWIIEDNKAFDNRLEGSGQGATGSRTVTGSRITDLLSLLISLYEPIPDIRNIYEWLSSPYHPLPAKFRYSLAEKITSTGGYLNEDCKELITRFINGDFEDNESGNDENLDETEKARKEKKAKKERDNKVRLFLPYFYNLNSSQDVQKGIAALSAWAAQRVNYITEPEEKETLTPQFIALSDAITNLQLLLFSEKSDDISAETLLKWCPEVTPEINLTQYHAKVGSRQVINFSGDIASPVDNIVWLGVEGMESTGSECDFLFPGEREMISKDAEFIENRKETKVKEILETLPFFMAEKSIILSYAEKNANEPLTLNPLLIRLQSAVKNLKDFVTDVKIWEYKTEKVEEINNSEAKPEFAIKGNSDIRWPEVMSASSIESLIFNPFDFFFEKILRLRSAGLNNLPSMEISKGKVAHKVIEMIFNPKDGETINYRDKLSKDYDSLLEEALKNQGALLLLPENRIELKLFRLQLEESLQTLIKIIEINKLTVIGCEENIYKKIGIAEGNEDGHDVHGYLDMHLKDSYGNHVVLDFKWSPGSHYKNLLKKDRSIQLAVYSLLVREDDNPNVSTAYFFMPGNELVTRHAGFVGENVVYIDTEPTENLVEKILNSVTYRKKQIEDGWLEGYDGKLLEDLQYYGDIEEQNLLRLLESDNDESVKKINKFSNYKIFKGL